MEELARGGSPGIVDAIVIAVIFHRIFMEDESEIRKDYVIGETWMTGEEAK